MDTTATNGVALRAVDYVDVMRRHRREILRDRVPYSVMVELTHRCNLRCVHCYCPPRAAAKGELTVAEWGVLFDKLAKAGTMQVCLTGGDPLLRRDFPEIYLAAKARGFLVTVFTNGTLVTPDIVDLWTRARPRRVEISLYGRSDEVYTAVTRVPGAWRKCYENVRTLLEKGIDIELKTVAITLTRDEVHEMKAFAESLGVPFRFDGRIHPRIDGSFKPLAYRLNPRQLAELEVADAKAKAQLRGKYTELQRQLEGDDTVFMCGAGIVAATIDPYGRLQLCIITRKPGIDVLHGDFEEVWNGVTRRIRETKSQLPPEKRELMLTERCPGFSFLEHGDLEKPSAFLEALVVEERRLAVPGETVE